MWNPSTPDEPIGITEMDVRIYPFHFYLLPWNVVQYYRESSVFLATTSYDNEYAHTGSNNTDYWKATPLNTTGGELALLNCLNKTIAASIPIIDPTVVVLPPYAPKDRLSSGQIAGIVVGSVVGVLLLVGLVIWLYIRRRQAHEYNAVSEGVATPADPRSST